MSTVETISTDYNSLWIGIGVSAFLLIICSFVLFFYLRYRKKQILLKQKKHIAIKANSIFGNRPTLKSLNKFDLDLYTSNNRSDNRLMDEIVKRSDKEKEAFNIFSQSIKKASENFEIQI